MNDASPIENFCLAYPGLRLVALGAVGCSLPFRAAAQRFRYIDARGQSLVDLSAIFDAEAASANQPKLIPLSAVAAPPGRPARPRRWTDADGRVHVDLAAIFEDEAKNSNLMNL